MTGNHAPTLKASTRKWYVSLLLIFISLAKVNHTSMPKPQAEVCTTCMKKESQLHWPSTHTALMTNTTQVLSSSFFLTESQFYPGWQCAQLNIHFLVSFVTRSSPVTSCWPMRYKRESSVRKARCDALRCSGHAVTIKTDLHNKEVKGGEWGSLES